MGQMYTEHNPQYFKDPYKCNPDCWSTDNIHPFAQLPFAFGPRACWGICNDYYRVIMYVNR